MMRRLIALSLLALSACARACPAPPLYQPILTSRFAPTTTATLEDYPYCSPDTVLTSLPPIDCNQVIANTKPKVK